MRKSPNRPIRNAAESISDIHIATLDTPEAVVQFCIKKKLIDGPALDIEKLIELAPELELCKAELGEIDASLEKIGHQQYRITVNSKQNKSRQRFSMAHEFAHYQLHREIIHELPVGEQILHRSEESNPRERQANNFAAEILMAEELFRKQVLAHDGDIEKIASAFNVSQIAVRYRAKNLGMRGHGV